MGTKKKDAAPWNGGSGVEWRRKRRKRRKNIYLYGWYVLENIRKCREKRESLVWRIHTDRQSGEWAIWVEPYAGDTRSSGPHTRPTRSSTLFGLRSSLILSVASCNYAYLKANAVQPSHLTCIRTMERPLSKSKQLIQLSRNILL